jgi:serine/threonine protein kinase
VYKTRYQEEAVVVKQMQSMDHEFTKEFIKEAKLMLALEHQNVVKLKGICLNPKALMMEFVCFDFKPFGDEQQVNNLSDFLCHIDTHNDCEGFTHLMPVIARNVASGLEYLHEKDVIHRDIKTANVLVSNQHYSAISDEKKFAEIWEANPVVCKLTDFGEGRSREVQTRTLLCTRTANVNLGTPAFPLFSKARSVLKPVAVVEMLLSKDGIPPSKVCTVQPLQVCHQGTFFVNLTSLKSTQDLKCDDVGVWINNSHDKFYFNVTWTDDFSADVLQVKSSGPKTATLKREYFTLKHDSDFKKRIDYLYCKFLA